MTRKIRNQISTPYLHVLVQGVNKEPIFNEKKDIKKYQNLLFKLNELHNVKIIAYCIMNNHAHILVKINNSKELSEFMKLVNLSYARYYNKTYSRVGHVFRDRFKSEEISTREYLYNCINYIHKNPVKAGICSSEAEYEFSSFNKFKQKSDVFNNISNSEKIFLDTLEDKEQACEEIIDIFLKANYLTKKELKRNKICLNNLLKILKIRNQLTCSEISKLLKINRETLRKLINELE